jgi:hypothetical protein
MSPTQSCRPSRQAQPAKPAVFALQTLDHHCNAYNAACTANVGRQVDRALHDRLTSKQVPLPQVPLPPIEFSIRLEDVELCRRPDGSLWQLGSGGFGTGGTLMYEPPDVGMGLLPRSGSASGSVSGWRGPGLASGRRARPCCARLGHSEVDLWPQAAARMWHGYDLSALDRHSWAAQCTKP